MPGEATDFAAQGSHRNLEEETKMSKVRDDDSNSRKAGPLEETWMKRHQRQTGCKCNVVKKKGFVTYVCTKCGKEI
jgi:hypothetical protein